MSKKFIRKPKLEGTSKVKVTCDNCDGKGSEDVTRYPDLLTVTILCRGCYGRGYSMEELAKK